ncbi:MAG: hypothetical protein ACI810_001234 [Gammaproteobacteria bacterium]|jgi:hypothetical protein
MEINTLTKPLLVAVATLLLMGVQTPNTHAAKPPIDVKSYLTSKQVNGVPTYKEEIDFTCTDQVYLIIETGGSESTEPSEHQLSVIWHNPSGKVEQRTLYDFTHYLGGSRVWAWLRLSSPPGAAVARLFDPAFGMGEFIGTWRAVVKIDRKEVAAHEFEVLC